MMVIWKLLNRINKIKEEKWMDVPHTLDGATKMENIEAHYGIGEYRMKNNFFNKHIINV